jgi:hypothetical protein
MDPTPSPASLINRYHRLQVRRELLAQQRQTQAAALGAITERLKIADAVKLALEQLTDQLFSELIGVVEQQLSTALQDVLEQPLRLIVQRGTRGGRTELQFFIERDGQREDIMKAQGGSVVNVLSVGLRMLAITTLPESEHRRFLVLDEQDCWLRPDLVPRLVRIVQAAGRALGFQTLMISHHDAQAFSDLADAVYRCTPTPQGVQVRRVGEEF